MKLLLRFSVTILLFTCAVCAVAAVAHRAEKESNLIHLCRQQLADQGLKHVDVTCRGSQAVLAGKVSNSDEKTAALDLIGSLDGIQGVSSMGLIVASIGTSIE